MNSYRELDTAKAEFINELKQVHHEGKVALEKESQSARGKIGKVSKEAQDQAGEVLEHIGDLEKQAVLLQAQHLLKLENSLSEFTRVSKRVNSAGDDIGKLQEALTLAQETLQWLRNQQYEVLVTYDMKKLEAVADLDNLEKELTANRFRISPENIVPGPADRNQVMHYSEGAASAAEEIARLLKQAKVREFEVLMSEAPGIGREFEIEIFLTRVEDGAGTEGPVAAGSDHIGASVGHRLRQ